MMSVQRDLQENRYTQPARVDPYLRQQQAYWFRTAFHWDIFATLTFSHDLTSVSANAVLGRYLRRIEGESGAPLACLIAEEGGTVVLGEATGRIHFHLLIRCSKPLDALHLVNVWQEDCFGGVRTVGPSAEVRPYKREISAVFYMLKGLRDPGWGWSEWRIEGASKRKPKRLATSKEARRMWKREQNRAQRFLARAV